MEKKREATMEDIFVTVCRDPPGPTPQFTETLIRMNNLRCTAAGRVLAASNGVVDTS